MTTTDLERQYAVRGFDKYTVPLLQDWGCGPRTIQAMRHLFEFDETDAGEEMRQYAWHVVALSMRWRSEHPTDEPLLSEAWPGRYLQALVNAASGCSDWSE